MDEWSRIPWTNPHAGNYIEYLEGRYMLGSLAMHKLGNLSRDVDPKYPAENICVIFGEEGSDYIGNWAAGFGFIQVRFPKETTRELTEEETAYWEKEKFVLI